MALSCLCNVLVRITSWYPNFNGSHFGLPPSEIHRMTGLPPKTAWTMTYRTGPISNLTPHRIWPPRVKLGRRGLPAGAGRGGQIRPTAFAQYSVAGVSRRPVSAGQRRVVAPRYSRLQLRWFRPKPGARRLQTFARAASREGRPISYSRSTSQDWFKPLQAFVNRNFAAESRIRNLLHQTLLLLTDKDRRTDCLIWRK